MANKKTINAEHSDITERSRSNQSVQRRPLKEVLKGRRPKSNAEIGNIVNGVLDMRRDMFDKEASFEFADRIADPHDEYGDRAIETVGGVVSYIADINSYEALSGLLEAARPFPMRYLKAGHWEISSSKDWIGQTEGGT